MHGMAGAGTLESARREPIVTGPATDHAGVAAPAALPLTSPAARIPAPRSLVGAADPRAATVARAHSGRPASTQRRNSATRSGGQAPSHGIVPAASRSRIASA